MKEAVEQVLLDLAKNDPKRTIKASAIAALGEYRNPEFAPIFKSALNDSSYSVSGYALEALSGIDSATALTEAKRLSKQTAKGPTSNFCQ